MVINKPFLAKLKHFDEPKSMQRYFKNAMLLVATALVTFSNNVAYAEDWAGGYVGLHAGFQNGQVKDDYSGFIANAPWLSYIDQISIKGAVVGGLVGYNFQNNALVYGIEGDFGLANTKGTLDFPGDGTIGAYITDVNINWNSHVRARIGLSNDKALFFVSAGLAVAQFDYGYAWPDRGLAQVYHSNGLEPGLSLGAGIEYKFNPDFQIRAEYLYDRYGVKNFVFNDTPDDYIAIDDVSFDTHTFRLSVSHRF